MKAFKHCSAIYSLFLFRHFTRRYFPRFTFYKKVGLICTGLLSFSSQSADLIVNLPSKGSASYRASSRPPAGGSWRLWCAALGTIAYNVSIEMSGKPQSRTVCNTNTGNTGPLVQGTFNASGTIDAYAASSPGISVRFKIVSDDGKRDYVGLSDISLSKSLSCGSSVKSVELGELYQGVNYTAELEITKTGKGQVTFKGSDLLSDGVVHLGGQNTGILVYPTDKGTFSSGASWFSSGDRTSIPLAVTVNSNALSGSWTSTLNAVLTCE